MKLKKIVIELKASSVDFKVDKNQAVEKLRKIEIKSSENFKKKTE